MPNPTIVDNQFYQAPRNVFAVANPAPTSSTPTAGSSSSTGNTSSPGAYQGVVINAGTDAEVAAQMAAIDAQKRGYDPKRITNPTSPTSSSTVGMNNNIQTNTASGLSTANGEKTPLSSLQSKIMSTYGFDEDYVRGLNSAAQAQFALSLRSEDVAAQAANQAKSDQEASYRASLAQQNAQYAQHTSDLQSQKEKDLNMAKVTAAQLNPYGGPNTDENNYSASINNGYQKLQAQLDNQAAMAKAALDAGNFKAYAEINSNMAKIKSDGIANIQSMLLDLDKSAVQQQQFADTLALSKESKAVTERNTNFDNLTTLLAKPGGVPSSSDLQSMGDNDLLLTPAGQLMSSLGYKPAQIRQTLSGAAQEHELTASGKESLMASRTENLRLQQERLDLAQNKDQRALDVVENVASTQQQLASKGISPSSAQYALALASATAGSKDFLNGTEIKDIYGSINLLGELDSVKQDINAIMGNSQVSNFILAKAGKDVQSILNAKDIAVITARMNSLAPSIAKNLNGQVGSLSDRDIAAALTALPSGASNTAINKALYDVIIDSAKRNLITKTAAYSSSYRNMSGYVPQIEQVLNQASGYSSKGGSTKSTYTPSFDVDAYIKSLTK